MICPKCNNEIPEESVFCPRCGFAVSGAAFTSNVNNSKKNTINLKAAIVAIAAIVILGIASAVSIYNSQPSTKYAKAEKAFANGDFEKAVELYTAAGTYKDASDKLTEANYGLSYVQGKEQMDDAKYDEAIELFEASNAYEDAEDLIIQCNYLKGIQLMDNGEYDDASACFKISIDYEDSNEKIIEMGQLLVTNGEYEKGANILGYSKKGDKDPYALYARGKIAYDARKYSDAAASFSGAGNILDAKELYTDAMYNDAQSKFSARSYSTASTLFGKVKGYKDADDMILACQLMEAKNKMDGGYLNQAKEALEKIDSDYSYKDIKVQDLLDKLEANSKWLAICGIWTSTSGQMRSTQSGSYYNYWWYRDFEEGDVNMVITCVINSDDTVTVKLESSVPVYYTYSPVASGVKEKDINVKIEQVMSDLGTVKFDDVTSVKIGKDGMAVNYKVVDRSKDVYFSYIYKTDVKYGKRTTVY